MMDNRIEKSVSLPEGFQAEVAGNKVTIKNQGKETSREFKANGIAFSKDNGGIKIVGAPATRRISALVSTISSHIQNMANGLENEYVYKMIVVFSHFPMNVAVKGNVVEIKNFVGEKKTRYAKIVEGATVEVKGKNVTIKSHDKEAAGQTAANLEGRTKVTGKDRRIYQDGIFIVEKAIQEVKESK